MTQQETFDIVVSHLRKQGRRAVNDRGQCVFRAPNGDKCAVGCLIPDDRYRPAFDRMGDVSDGLIPPPKEPVRNIVADLGHDIGLCSDLRYIHDYYPPEQWEPRFSMLAAKKQLRYSPPATGIPNDQTGPAASTPHSTHSST